MGNTEHLQRRDISFVSFIAILEFALALAAPSGGDALFGGVSVPAWYTFYVNKLFAGLYCSPSRGIFGVLEGSRHPPTASEALCS